MHSSLNQINQPKSRQPARTIYFFHYIENADPNTFNPFRVHLIGHPFQEVVTLWIKKIRCLERQRMFYFDYLVFTPGERALKDRSPFLPD